MKEIRWQVLFGALLIVLSAVLYYVHYAIFHDPHHIFIYLMGDIAFVPIEVLLVTLIIHRLLEHKEKRSRLEKTNMVIEVFFSQVGTRLLEHFSDNDPDIESIRNILLANEDWTDKGVKSIRRRLGQYRFRVDVKKINLGELAAFLSGKRGFFVSLWENPNLLEHESFTEVLRAVMHLTEELVSREGMGELPESDYEHLAGDGTRAYSRLVVQWLDYMKHLKENYPYLFSLAKRTNPFDREASPLVT